MIEREIEVRNLAIQPRRISAIEYQRQFRGKDAASENRCRRFFTGGFTSRRAPIKARFILPWRTPGAQEPRGGLEEKEKRVE